MKKIQHLILILTLPCLFFACDTENTLDPSNSDDTNTDITANEYFEATWNISSGGAISSMAFTSDGLATVQGTASNSRTLVEQKDLLFYGGYTVQSDTIIDLEGYGTIKVLNVDGNIEIELIKEDNPEEKISLYATLDNTTYSEKTAFLSNIWKDEEGYYVYFTKDGALLTSDGSGIWEWIDDSEEALKVKIEDDIYRVDVVELTEENFTIELNFEENDSTFTQTINMTRADYEEFLENVEGFGEDHSYAVPAEMAGHGTFSIDGEEVFKIRGAAGRQNEVFENDSSGRFFDLVFMEDISVLDELEEYEGDDFIGNMVSLGITTSADTPKELAGDYSKGSDWEDNEDATTAPDYAVQFAGATTEIDGEFTLFLKNHDDEGLTIDRFNISKGKDKTYIIDAVYEVNKVSHEDDTTGEKVKVHFHYEGKIFFITD
ncbi:hypothetical protein [Flammeovirga sp. SubArs3]|uniref:hypothetical protein n=1 Tax=Flammeovirga sp. SubArs3 TaxID=2995316 RepID=UPI00248AD85F|nr:hypothetical protein [Flammeovirga sp. SubArs3]